MEQQVPAHMTCAVPMTDGFFCCRKSCIRYPNLWVVDLNQVASSTQACLDQTLVQKEETAQLLALMAAMTAHIETQTETGMPSVGDFQT